MVRNNVDYVEDDNRMIVGPSWTGGDAGRTRGARIRSSAAGRRYCCGSRQRLATAALSTPFPPYRFL